LGLVAVNRDRPTDRPALWHVILALVAVVGLSALVGCVGSDGGFSGELASVFGTAMGTTLLSAATYWLAYSTRSEVRATQRLADSAEQDRRERLRPLVIGAAERVDNDRDGMYLSVGLHNIGGGPAMRIAVTAEHEGKWEVSAREDTLPVLVSGGQFPFAIRISSPQVDAAKLDVDDFRVRGHYLDRRARRVPLRIIDWKHDELPAEGYPNDPRGSMPIQCPNAWKPRWREAA
jgi:hypothetical protein